MSEGSRLVTVYVEGTRLVTVYVEGTRLVELKRDEELIEIISNFQNCGRSLSMQNIAGSYQVEKNI